MPEVEGWSHHRNYFGESENGYWKIVLAKPMDEGYKEVYISNLSVLEGKLHVKGYNVPITDQQDFRLDHEGIEQGKYEPGPHGVYDLDFTQSLGDIADKEEMPERELSLEHYIRELISKIEEG